MKIELTAFPRTVQGTGASRRLRRTGKVPGIVYGANQSALPIEVDHQALYRHLKIEAFHSSILDMTLEGAHQQVLLRDVQMHPFKQQVLHIDFQRIDKNQKIHMRVPLHFVNAETAPGVKLGGGIANHIMNEIEIQCLPAALPEFIEVDLGKLELGQSVHVNDIALPEGVELISRLKKENPGIAAVQLPKVMVVEEEAAAPVTEIITEKPVEGEAGEGKDGAEKKDAEKKDASKKD